MEAGLTIAGLGNWLYKQKELWYTLSGINQQKEQFVIFLNILDLGAHFAKIAVPRGHDKESILETHKSS